VIVDPVSETVTHLVVEPRFRLSAARLVQLDLVGGFGLADLGGTCGAARTSSSRPAR
jgi:hypothetical protein